MACVTLDRYTGVCTGQQRKGCAVQWVSASVPTGTGGRHSGRGKRIRAGRAHARAHTVARKHETSLEIKQLKTKTKQLTPSLASTHAAHTRQTRLRRWGVAVAFVLTQKPRHAATNIDNSVMAGAGTRSCTPTKCCSQPCCAGKRARKHGHTQQHTHAAGNKCAWRSPALWMAISRPARA